MDTLKSPLDTQKALEKEMLQASLELSKVRALRAQEQGAEDNQPYGARLLKATVLPTSERVTGWLEQAGSGKAGRRHASHAYIAAAGADIAALVVCRTILSTISGRTTYTEITHAIGQRMETEARMIDWREVDPEHYSKTLDHVAHSGSATYRRTVMNLMANRAEHEWEEWSRDTHGKVGEKLLELFIEATGLCQIETIWVSAERRSTIVTATEECLKWIEEAREANALLHPQYWPLVCPPKPWSGPRGGIYYTLPRKLKLIKTRSAGLLEEMEHMDLSLVYEAVNAVQASSFRIDRWALDLLETCVAQGIEVEGLPLTHPVEIPLRPEGLTKGSEEEKEWKRAAAQAHEAEAERRSTRRTVADVLGLARRFKEYPEWWLGTQLDFRGRFNYLSVLSPQGADWTKALIQSGRGKPIETPEQLRWLAVALANEWGYDKVSFADRCEWVYQNEERILAVAADPLAERWWMDADGPFRFASLCREWANCVEHGWGYVSHAFVQLDGTCNGLQHYGAMLRDPIGGAAVNLVPAEKPNDVYGQVSVVLTGKLRRILSLNEGNEDHQRMARLWLALAEEMGRKLTKRQVMVLPYGGTQQSCREYTRKALDAWLETKTGARHSYRTSVEYRSARMAASPFTCVTAEGKESDGTWAAAAWLTPILWESIGEVVVAARQAMDWLREVARVVTSEGLPVTWFAPDGLPIQQDYREDDVKRIDTVLFGTLRLQTHVAVPTDRINKAAHATGIAPNFVHSQDAAMLREYVRLAALNGIQAFNLIHDSFGTLAADVDMMRACLRAAMRGLYEYRDCLGELRDHLRAQVPEKKQSFITDPPAPGSLDLSVLEEAEYMFA
nr:DNA-directed RNA polymerase [Roseomonas sp. GC11]